MQAGEHHDDGRLLLGRVRPHRNAAAIVGHRNRAVQMHPHQDVAGIPRQRLVGGVVDHFLDHMGGRIGARVHARSRTHRFKALEDLDRGFVVKRHAVGVMAAAQQRRK
jgi:hypothetical protein